MMHRRDFLKSAAAAFSGLALNARSRAAAPALPAQASARELLLEAECFAEPGGWVIDPQFMAVMGSPYLLAHGLGRPVANARASADFPGAGAYHLWVRAKDWVPAHHPGRFRVKINGQALPDEFGASGQDWSWQHAGPVEIPAGKALIELEDLTGFDGRCDALFFTTDPAARPPEKADAQMAAWRRRLLGQPEDPPSAGTFDVVIVGGGVPGCAAALTAARLGLKTALIHNRPVLGGNGSPEIGITLRDQGSPLLNELSRRNARGELSAETVLRAQPNLTLCLGWTAHGVVMEGPRIARVIARKHDTAQDHSFEAPLFIDCTGMARLGALAGALLRTGREARAEFGEPLAPEKADAMHHGNSPAFRTRLAEQPVTFPEVPWATAVAKDHADLGGQILSPGRDNAAGGLTHYWEYGQWLDPIQDAERIRDHLLCAVYGTFANAKKKWPEKNANLELAYVGFIAATGEGPRLVGDHVLNQKDIIDKVEFPDVAAINAGHFCLHYPGDKYDFRLGKWKWDPVKPFGVPLRCLYSRNVPNLLMAGKHISVTHVAGSATKTMLNGGQHGVAVGVAAFLCKKHNTTPRGVHDKHLAEFQEIVFRKGAHANDLAPRR